MTDIDQRRRRHADLEDKRGSSAVTTQAGHFLLELGARLKLVGLGSSEGYNCPLTQYLLADALGLSAVHVNRVLRELREDGQVSFQNGKVVFKDFDGLVEFSEFDRHYLDHDGPLIK